MISLGIPDGPGDLPDVSLFAALTSSADVNAGMALVNSSVFLTGSKASKMFSTTGEGASSQFVVAAAGKRKSAMVDSFPLESAPGLAPGVVVHLVTQLRPAFRLGRLDRPSKIPSSGEVGGPALLQTWLIYVPQTRLVPPAESQTLPAQIRDLFRPPMDWILTWGAWPSSGHGCLASSDEIPVVGSR
ncbi:hypothetical protein AGLY_006424 [Aphis glycines]|uniref:Uncharacterized protein n=1 Tax=Aphis glycines TaxID=307491 RepID=A0A6G0TTC6_APHGL|nr:hypothetical protein AGLY_006424 [Aphis glycines]